LAAPGTIGHGRINSLVDKGDMRKLLLALEKGRELEEEEGAE
jgi:hypothetical protein